MPAARAEADGPDGKPAGRKEGPPIANIARQIEEVKRQKARMEATPKRAAPKKVSAVSLAASAVSPVLRALKGTPVGKIRRAPLGASRSSPQATLVRLRAATNAAPRRLGVPLRNTEGGPPRKKLRIEASGVALHVKQQVHSDDENFSAPTKIVPRMGFGYGDDRSLATSDEEAMAAPAPEVRTKKVKAQLVAGRHSNKANPRDRKMLGGLLQHLASARHRLVEEGNVTRKKASGAKAKLSGRQAEPQSLGVARLLVKKELLPEPRRPVAVTRRPADEREQETEDVVDQARVEREMAMLQHRLEAHYSLMKNYIRTRTEPTIFYLPVRHTKETKQALQETREAIESKVASLRAHLRAEDDGEEEAVEDDHYEPSEPHDMEDGHLWSRVAEGGSG